MNARANILTLSCEDQNVLKINRGLLYFFVLVLDILPTAIQEDKYVAASCNDTLKKI